MTSSIPRPGEHLEESAQTAATVTQTIADLLQQVGEVQQAALTPDGLDLIEAMGQQATLLDHAHDALARALATVDKV